MKTVSLAIAAIFLSGCATLLSPSKPCPSPPPSADDPIAAAYRLQYAFTLAGTLSHVVYPLNIPTVRYPQPQPRLPLDDRLIGGPAPGPQMNMDGVPKYVDFVVPKEE